VCCSVLQCVAACCSVIQLMSGSGQNTGRLRCVVVCYSVLQCVAV